MGKWIFVVFIFMFSGAWLTGWRFHPEEIKRRRPARIFQKDKNKSVFEMLRIIYEISPGDKKKLQDRARNLVTLEKRQREFNAALLKIKEESSEVQKKFDEQAKRDAEYLKR